MEPWRQWLLSTGWDGLQRIRKNTETGLDLSTEDRHYINNYIAENGNLANQLIALMMEKDDYWESELQSYVKARGLKDQSQFPVKKTLLYRRINEIHDRAFAAAIRSLNAYKSQYTVVGREMQNRDIELGRGAFNKAEETQKRIQDLLFDHYDVDVVYMGSELSTPGESNNIFANYEVGIFIQEFDINQITIFINQYFK